MQKKVIIALMCYLVILLVIFGIESSRGEDLEHLVIDMTVDSNIGDQEKITCINRHGDVLSTEAIFNEFINDCEITMELDYPQSYFSDKVLIVYYHNASIYQEPTKFYDYFWSVDGYEVIKVNTKNTLFQFQKTDTYKIYLIEIDKDDILGSNIYFD